MLADVVPLYTLYALLFAETGLTEAQISALFAIWSVVGVLAEVPTGALADRFSRRTALVAGSVAQAACYALWTAHPGFLAFAAGFVLWGLGGTLVSGALEALLYDGLAAAGAGEHFARVYGDVHAMGLVAQLPAAAAAALLYPVGGFALVGWASVGTCLTAAFVASRLPEPPRAHGEPDGAHRTRYLFTLRTGIAEAFRRPLVRGAVLAVALLASLDGLEEYFPLLAGQWQVPVTWIPLAVVAIPLAGAVGSALAGRLGLHRLRAGRLALLLAASVPPLLLASVLARPVSLVAVAAGYAVYRAVLVVGSARLQERIESTSRATVTSVAGLGTDLASLLLFGAWAVAGLPAVAVLALLVAAALPYGLRSAGSGVRGRVPT
ncbi:arabinose efflux permease family protein [Saccharomonospora marina XMU15]|uniref:Arabinose efflux permease family protein n=1 Tax=Saccharomonospora marina XMU15 TaxID=882083 RepID=H5X7X4_9PSEU|nr:MFS transporter [Saccharomonospora marina]EHR52474.1 arabinose efflux permease family protein [Saccharomonospora marina XMU15]